MLVLNICLIITVMTWELGIPIGLMTVRENTSGH
jgi:hypothetical protein